MNGHTLCQDRAVYCTSFKGAEKKIAFLRDFRDVWAALYQRAAAFSTIGPVFGKWIIVSSVEARRSCATRDENPFWLLGILQLVRLTFRTLSAVVQLPFITDFNSHTHEISMNHSSHRDRFPDTRDNRVFRKSYFRSTPEEFIYRVIYLDSVKAKS